MSQGKTIPGGLDSKGGALERDQDDGVRAAQAHDPLRLHVHDLEEAEAGRHAEGAGKAGPGQPENRGGAVED
jgi:hypothetical protein